MAYTDSVFTAAQVELGKLFSEAELRLALRPANTILLKNAPALFANLQQIEDSEGTQADAFYMTRTTDTVANARIGTHTGDPGTSAHETLAFTTYARNFSFSQKNSQHNVFNAARMMANDIYNTCADIHIAIETDSIAWFETNKSGVNDYSGDFGTFDGTDDIFNVLNTDKDRFFSIVKTMMSAGNDYAGNLDVIFSADGQIIFNEQAAQGVGNDKNLAYQLAGFDFSGVTSGITTDADELLQMYTWEKGRAAMVARIPKINTTGLETPVADYFTFPCPFGSGITFAVHAYWAKSDGGTYSQDVLRYYQVSVDISRGDAPLSTEGETVIQKCALLTSND